MRKIVVTGGSGRLGQETIRTLRASGYLTLNLDRVPPREAQGDFRLADLCRSGDLYEAFKGAHGVVHLGAYQAPNMTADTETFNNNVTATYNVLKVAAESGWFAARPSGTEDIYKIYAESFKGEDHLHQIQTEAREIVQAAFDGA